MQLAGSACMASVLQPAFADSLQRSSESGSSRPLLGVVVRVHDGETIDGTIKRVHDLGLPTCQIGFDNLSADVAKPTKTAMKKYGVRVTAISEHAPGRRVFNFYEGPKTVGFIPPVPSDLCNARIRNLKLAADVAAECDIPAVHTHCGFIPEDPNNPLYQHAVSAVKEVVTNCKERGRIFLCETGEETPITLLRLIEDVGLDNVFVNMDVANLILYGKGNPVDAMEVVGHLVRGVHVKDGLFPTNPRDLGKEVIIGQGKVDFPRVLKQLKQANYTGALTIERETNGEQQRKDILQSKIYLEKLMATIYS